MRDIQRHPHDLRSLSDEHLGRLATAGDRDAFGELFGRHEHGLLNFCHRLTGDRDEAADLVQESFLRVFAQLDRLEGRDVNLAAYLRRVARNLVYDRAPRRAAEVPVADATLVAGADQDLEVDPERALLLDDQQRLVRAANDALGERQRLALALRELEGMDYRGIGEVLGLRPDAVAQLLARARLALRRGLRLRQVDEDAMSDACRARLVAISALVDGELDADRAHVLEGHLATCATCRDARAAMEEAGQRYRLWLPIPIIAGLGGRVLTAAEQGGLLVPTGAVSGGAAGAGGGGAAGGGLSGPAADPAGGSVLSQGAIGEGAGGPVSGGPGPDAPPGADTVADLQDAVLHLTPDAGAGGVVAGDPGASASLSATADGGAGGGGGATEPGGPLADGLGDAPADAVTAAQKAVESATPGSPTEVISETAEAVGSATPGSGGVGGGAEDPDAADDGGVAAYHISGGAGAGAGALGAAVPRILGAPEEWDREEARHRRRGLAVMAGAGLVALLLGGVSAVYALRDTPPPPSPPPVPVPTEAAVTTAPAPATTTVARTRSAPARTTTTAPRTTSAAPTPAPPAPAPATTAPAPEPDPPETTPTVTAPTRTAPTRTTPPATVQTTEEPPATAPPATTTGPTATDPPPTTTQVPPKTETSPNDPPPTTTTRPPRTIRTIIRPPIVTIRTIDRPPPTTTAPPPVIN